MNLEETCYLQTLPQHDSQSPFRYKYGDKVRIVAANKGYLDWMQGLVIKATQDNGSPRYLIRCIPDREEIWLTELAGRQPLESRDDKGYDRRS